MTGEAVNRIAEGDEVFSNAELRMGGGARPSLCTCPYCNRSFGLSDDGEPIPESPEQKISCYCSKCDYRWNSLVEEPKRCPNCGSYHWKEMKLSLECTRCGHAWVSRRGVPPLRCPKCRSLYWNRPRIVPGAMPVYTAKEIKKQYLERAEVAIRRCSEGEGLYDVCNELDVAVIEIALAIVENGKEYRV